MYGREIQKRLHAKPASGYMGRVAQRMPEEQKATIGNHARAMGKGTYQNDGVNGQDPAQGGEC